MSLSMTNEHGIQHEARQLRHIRNCSCWPSCPHTCAAADPAVALAAAADAPPVAGEPSDIGAAPSSNPCSSLNWSPVLTLMPRPTDKAACEPWKQQLTAMAVTVESDHICTDLAT